MGGIFVKYSVLLACLFIFFSCSETPSDAPIDSYRDVEINIDMNKAIADGLFDVNIDVLVLLIDSVNEYVMSDANGDQIFSITISNLIFGKTYEYQYSVNDNFEILEGDRTFTVYDVENSVSDYYGELNPTIVIFLVDMSYQIELGNFNPDVDFLVITGILNNWDEGDLLNDSDNNDLYEITFSNLSVSDELVFKFKINENNWESPNPDVSDCIEDGYGGFNRIYTVKQGENIVEYCYNDECGN